MLQFMATTKRSTRSPRGPLRQPTGDVFTPTPGQRAEVRRLRLARGFSTRALAKFVGCSNGTITNLETGDKQVNRGYYEAIVRALGVGEDDDEATRATYHELLETAAQLDLRGLRVTLASAKAYLAGAPED